MRVSRTGQFHLSLGTGLLDGLQGTAFTPSCAHLVRLSHRLRTAASSSSSISSVKSWVCPTPPTVFNPMSWQHRSRGWSVYSYKLSMSELGVHAVCQLAREHDYHLAFKAPQSEQFCRQQLVSASLGLPASSLCCCCSSCSYAQLTTLPG